MSYHGATGCLPSATQEAVDKDCHVIDVHLAIQVTVGGNIAGKFTVLAEGEAADRTDITFLEYLPLFNSDGTPQ